MAPARESVTVTDDGVRLVGILERPSAEPGPLVLVLHGFTSAKDRPHTVAACVAMREAGFATLRFDLYGHGESGGEFRKHTLHKWISNTLTVMDWAERQDFVTELWLSGHSQGGLTAALVAGTAPERVRGLVLRAPAFMIPRCAREGEMLGVRFDPSQIPEPFPTIKGLTLDADYFRSARAIRVEEAIDAFPGSVLLLHGEADDVVPLRDVETAAGRYRSCKLALIPGETHHFDQAREHMKSVIRDWLSQQRTDK
jgi:pimeloyl-ACP methyl ester carboxylesterase